MNRNMIGGTVIAILLYTGSLILAQTATNDHRAPYIIGTTHIHQSVTVWSDGSIDITDAVQLTGRTARRLARRLEDAEDAARASRRIRPIRGTITGPTDLYCTAIASTTNKRCKNRAAADSAFCSTHATRTP